MFNAKQLCKKITTIYPAIGTCGIDINVTRDLKEDTWVVHLKKGNQNLKHYLEFKDANRCLDGKECVALGLEISQMRKNIEGKQF